ncbi:MAG: HD domain-containing protein [Desulfatitalea sp.]
MDKNTLAGQLSFILEADKLKAITRNTLLTDGSRFENAAEHSWHVALAAVVLFDSAPAKGMDLSRIVNMLLVHDLMEIDAGDLLCYDTDQVPAQKAKERKAAERIFNLLNDGQGDMLRQLWQEFDALETPEARFANAVDRLQPLLQALRTEGKTWQRHRIRKDQVIERMQPIRTALPHLWGDVLEMIADAADKGYLVK